METTHRPKAPQQSGKGGLGIIGGIVLLAVLFGIGLAPKLENDKQNKAEAAETATDVAEVEVVAAKQVKQDPLLLPGNIEAVEGGIVQARTSGYISKVYVDIGSHVKKGDVLADIQSPDVDQQVAQALADTARSRATVGQSQSDVARLQAGVAQSQSDLVRQQANIKQSEAAFLGSKAKLAVAQAGESSAEAALSQAEQGVEAQKANLAQAQANYEFASSTEKRYRNLLSQGFVAQQDYDQTVSGLKTAKASVDAVNANLSASKANYRSAQQAVRSAKALVESAQSDTIAARANIAASQATYESMKQTVKAAQASVTSGYSTVQANQAAVASSEANAKRYTVLSGFQHVVAPFDGVITARNVDAGSLVNPGTATQNLTNSTPDLGLFGISRSDVLRIYVDLPQSDFQWAREGNTAAISVRELPKDKFIGKIYRTAGAINEATRTMRTEIRLDNTQNKILPGMYARVLIAPPSDQTSLRVPSSVLSIDSSGVRVAVLDAQNHVHFKSVVLGKDYGTEAEVVSGIDPTDKIVNNPSDALKEGAEVKVVKGAKG